MSDSVTDTDAHPAFYHSKKRIWDFPITAPPIGSSNRSWRSRLNIYFVGGFDSLWKLWYTIFVVTSTSWLAWLAVLRLLEFKYQAFHPRFGVNWNWVFPLNLQVACLVLLLSLLLPLVYSAVSRMGHSANDGISLGRDCLYLHAMLAQLPILKMAQKSADPEAAERLRSRIVRSTQSLNDSPDFKSFIIREGDSGAPDGVTGGAYSATTCCGAARRQLRPFSSLIHVVMAFALFLPVSVFESEQIKNDAIPPDYVWHTNLDWILNGIRHVPTTLAPNATGHGVLGPLAEAKFVPQQSINNLPETLESYQARESDSGFPSHPFPSIPTDISPEFVLLAAALIILSVRFPAPFWFTSRPFSILLSVYVAITGAYILLEGASLELLIKIHTAGYRDSKGFRIDVIPGASQLLNTPTFVIVSVAGFFALIAGIMAFYAFGELLFRQAVTNYAKLIMAGEFEGQRHADNPACDERGSTLFEHIQSEGDDLYGPSVIAVTTKAWRPSRRSNNSQIPRTITPSALSTSCDTLRSKTNSNLVAPPNFVGKRKNIRSNFTFWPCLVSSLAFLCLAITRSCLFGPALQCYWYTGIKTPLVYVIVSIIYLILWLILWFGVAVKTAWRFRLLHMPAPLCSVSRMNSPKHRSQAERLVLGPSQFAPWPLMNNPAAAQLGANYFWPWLNFQNGFMPPQQNGGSLAFGSSPAPYDGGYLDRGGPSGVDSVYGCLPDTRQPPNCGGLLRAGPPTLSDESDNAMGYDQNASYAYLQKGAGLVSVENADAASQDSNPQQYGGSVGETAYASLASLGRAGSPQRSQGGSRRGVVGTRVTFKPVNEEVANGDANIGSSDSGVCTNGSGSRVVGKLNLSNHPLFIGSGIDRSKSPQGFLTENSPVRLENDDRLCSQV